MNDQIVAFRNYGPESFVKCPVGIWCKCKAVAWVVVAASSVLMNMAGLNDVAEGRLEAVSSESTGVFVASGDIGSESNVSSFLFILFERFAISAIFGHLGRVWNWQPKAGR